MKKSSNIALGLATLWPIMYLFIFFAFMIIMMSSMAIRGSSSDGPPKLFLVIFPLHFLTILSMFALIGIYIYHIFKTARVPQDKKALWAAVIFLGNMIAMPVYFYLYIWKEPPSPPLDGDQPSINP